LNGRWSIIADTALRLARDFGSSPQFWLDLQAWYDLETADNLETIRSACDAFAPGDGPAVLAVPAPDAGWTEAEGFPDVQGALRQPWC